MATRKLVVEGSSVTASQLKDLFRQIEDGSLDSYHIQALLERRDPFKISIDKDSQLASWHVFLTKIFGIKIDIESLVIPEQQPGFDRLIVVPKGLTLNKVLKACRDEFEVTCYTYDLNKFFTVNQRHSTKTYAVWVRERVEADEELAAKPAKDLKKEKIPGITLLERLLYELKNFAEIGKHLDVDNITLCSGSRGPDESVPNVSWYVDEQRLCIDWNDHSYQNSNLRSRAVVF